MAELTMAYPDLPKFALSIRQPWSHCILHLGKTVENRDWPTRFRGRVCIHAAKGMTRQEWEDCMEWARHVATVDPSLKGKRFPAFNELQRGGIVGTVEIVDVVTKMDSPWFFGKYGFVLRDPQPCDIIQVKGALSFFEWRKNLEVGR
ncbi:ASCH domain-containing protein [Sinorhizobium meliloti]|uniref:ASCH domain-containing protein n=1 Tax=Rhizobium meliloti TaxID=382 RepID=UPI001F1B128E|nr:ASCH domain-containing protein [Sinorhizobium meliloti]